MREIDPLIARAATGVARNAQGGGLPPFALTLGLSQSSFIALQAHVSVPDAPSHDAPPQFHSLVALLDRYRASDADPQQAEWLAHAIACAGFGHGHLWQEMGVSRREDVSQLLQTWFPEFFRRNTSNMRWKKFLFFELGAELGQPDLRPPHCEGCEEFESCFPGVAKTLEIKSRKP